MSTQTAIWEQPTAPVDPRPLETGGALVILRLTPAEVDTLAPYGFPLVEAVHAFLDRTPDLLALAKESSVMYHRAVHDRQTLLWDCPDEACVAARKVLT